ncbi:MAG: 2-C-methyl-D-erythritol 4-phosphate cytidylyltransferase [Magnetococcales bacterium]|nr:2-C-methyl-D-erythritol 4-phosphate cytidylyltransferase [Magnetococcales bacterium]
MSDHSTVPFIVVAAGSGRRFGASLPKQYQPLLGQPLLAHTLKNLHDDPRIGPILPVIAPDGTALWDQWMAPCLAELPKLLPPIAGGEERQASVFAGLQALTHLRPEWVGVHDGARPFVTSEMIGRLLAACRHDLAGVIVALPVADTVKWVDAGRRIQETLDRDRTWLAQTPQLFRYESIVRAHNHARENGFLGTDDASLLERLGLPVVVVPGDPRNIKVTRPEDLALLATFLEALP